MHGAEIRDEEIIRPFDRPVHPEGSIAILKGNLAPNGSVVKKSGVEPTMLVHTGPAVVFDSEEAVCDFLLRKPAQPGSVLVVR